MFFNSQYGKIYYETSGKGDPLVMIHGTPFSSKVWDFFVPVLNEKFQVFTYDLVGYGRSEKIDGDVSLGIQNKILVDLLDFWQINEPVIIAHDFGGATALRSILIDKQKYKKMVLMDAVALSPWGSPFVRHVRKHESVFSGIPDYIHEAIVKAYIKDALYNKVEDARIEFLVEPWLGAEGKAAFYRQIAQMDQKYTEEIEDRYPEINIPTKILWGSEDNWIPLSKGKELHSRLNGSEFTVIPDSGHLVQIDNPDRAIEEVVEFLY